MAYLDGLTNESIHHISKLPCLSSLTLEFLRGVSAAASTYIITCHGLISLKWEEDEEKVITNEFFRGLAKNCPGLEEIFLHNCTEVTNDGIMELTENCRRLSVLFLGMCPKFSDISLFGLGKNCPGLTNLVVGKINKGITDKGLVALATGCPSLKLVDIFSGTYDPKLIYKPITDIGVSALARSCRNLEHLSVQHFNITDKGISEFKSLMDLSLKGCRKITANGIEHLLENCRGILKSLNLEACTQFTEDQIQYWQEQNQNLQILFKNPELTEFPY